MAGEGGRGYAKAKKLLRAALIAPEEAPKVDDWYPGPSAYSYLMADLNRYASAPDPGFIAVLIKQAAAGALLQGLRMAGRVGKTGWKGIRRFPSLLIDLPVAYEVMGRDLRELGQLGLKPRNLLRRLSE